MNAITKNALLPAMLGMALVSCGGGGGVGQLAGGGISGTGTGTVTGFGSVIINDIRTFEIDADTTILWNGNEITEQQLETRGLGAVVTVAVGDDVSSDFTSGTAVSIEVDSTVKGPVTATDPLQVLGQTVIITGSTVFNEDGAPMPGFDPDTLQPGDIVEINGFPGSDNSVLAAWLETNTVAVNEWKLTGRVTATGAGTYSIGEQLVLDNVAPDDCNGAVTVGDLVEIRATADPGFGPGPDTLDTVTSVECIDSGLPVPANASGDSLEAEIEGLVNAFTSPADFEVNGQRVVTTIATEYEDGDPAKIALGVKLEAEGDLDINTGILTADSIRFRETQVRIHAPLAVPVGGLGSTFQMLDVITINTNSLTRDEDGLLDGSEGISGDRQVELTGFQDGSGNVIATEIKDTGDPEPGNVDLTGPVGDTCNPAVGDEEFDILGVIIVTSVDGTFVFDDEGPALLQQQFCDQAVTDTLVEVDTGSFSSGPARIENADEIELED